MAFCEFFLLSAVMVWILPFSDGCLWLDVLPVLAREIGIRVVLVVAIMGEVERASGPGGVVPLAPGWSNGKGWESVRLRWNEPERELRPTGAGAGSDGLELCRLGRGIELGLGA